MKSTTKLSFFNWMHTVTKIAWSELQFIFKSRICWFLLIILPVTVFPFFCFLFVNGTLKDVPVGVFDEDNSELSRSLTRAIESSKLMRISESFTDYSTIEKSIRSGHLRAVFYFPHNMESDLKSKGSVSITFLKNSQNIMIANYLYKDALTIAKTYSAGILIKKFKLSGFNDTQSRSLIQPIQLDVLYPGNPNFNYNYFLSPAYIFVIFQMIVMLAGMYSITHEIEYPKYSRLIPGLHSVPGALLTGKLIPLMLIITIISGFLQFVLFPLFSIQSCDSDTFTFGISFLFLLSSTAMGFFIGVICRKAMLAAEVIIFINMPCLLVSGYTFPDVPVVLDILGSILPYKHFIYAYLKLAPLHAPLYIIGEHIFILLIITIVSYFISWAGLQLANKHRVHQI